MEPAAHTVTYDANEYKKVYGTIAHADDNIKVHPEESLYQALERRKLLRKPSTPKGIGCHLVQQGELGLCRDNGRPVFLSPGRHTLWSPMAKYKDTVKISDALIELGPVQIVTINQGELGLSRKNGETILLDPGRYILMAPHKFEKTTAANAMYIELGTYRRITVPARYIAIAFDKGRQIIISPEDTQNGPFETNSPTFRFDEETGFQPVQLQVRELDELKVNTRDGITITAKGLLTYLIHDPHAAFMTVQDIHGAVKRAAEATLTNIFLNTSIDQIAPSIPTNSSNKDDKPRIDPLDNMSLENANFSHHIREAFLHDFTERVHEWGIKLKDLNIEKLEFDKTVQDLLRKRAQARLETATNLANMYAQTDVAVQEAERERKQKTIQADASAVGTRTNAEASFFATQKKAEADALAIRTLADADLYAAHKRAEAAALLSQNGLASQLEIKRLDIDIVRATGNKTTFLPLGVNIGEMGLREGKDPVIWTGGPKKTLA